MNIKITLNNNAARVQDLLESALSNMSLSIRVKYANGQIFEGGIHSYEYNHPKTALPPITKLSIYTAQGVENLDIGQILSIESI